MYKKYIEVGYNNNGEFNRRLGSDGTVPIDGRFGDVKCINDGYKYFTSMNKFMPSINAFRVYSNGRLLTERLF